MSDHLKTTSWNNLILYCIFTHCLSYLSGKLLMCSMGWYCNVSLILEHCNNWSCYRWTVCWSARHLRHLSVA